MDLAIVVAVLGALAVLGLGTGLRVINEYERGVVLRLGRLVGTLNPGMRYVLPFGIDRLIRVDLRTGTMDVSARDAVTVDGVPLQVEAVAYLQVLNPALAVTRVIDYRRATSQLALAAVRSVIAGCSLREVLTDQGKVRQALGTFVDRRTEPWGIKVTAMEIKNVELPQAMQQAMAQNADADRERRARIAQAEAELAAAHRLVDAARILETQPYAALLRYLQTVADLAPGNTTVVVLPLPSDLIQPFLDIKGRASDAPRRASGAPTSSMPPAQTAAPVSTPRAGQRPGTAQAASPGPPS